jgi:putative ABC transport system permease protein
MLFFLKLAFRNLFRQKLRSLLTALGIMVAIISFCLLHTVVAAWYGGVESASSSRLITRHAISLAFSLPIGYENKIRRADGVTGVSGAIWFGGIYINEKNFFPQFAIDGKNYFSLYPDILIPPEQKLEFLNDRKGAVVGRKLARTYGWKLGDVIPLKGTMYPGSWNFVIRGIYSGATSSVDETTFFFNWDYFNERLKKMGDSRADHVGIFLVGISRPERAAEISRTIDQIFKNSLAETLTETEKAFQLSFVAMVEAIIVAIRIVSLVVIGIIMAVMANTMAMGVRERTREYATLRALGFGSGYVATLIVGESLFLSLSAGIMGIACAYPLVDFLGDMLGTLFPVFLLSKETMAMALAASMIVGLVSAVFPVWRVLSQRVSEALRSMG